MTRKLSEEGEIKRTSEGVLVRALGGAHLLDQPGVECENPDVPELLCRDASSLGESGNFLRSSVIEVSV